MVGNSDWIPLNSGLAVAAPLWLSMSPLRWKCTLPEWKSPPTWACTNGAMHCSTDSSAIQLKFFHLLIIMINLNMSNSYPTDAV